MRFVIHGRFITYSEFFSMKNYEVNFIVSPVLSSDEISKTAQKYEAHIKEAGATIVHTSEMGLRQLAYPIKRKSSGVYYCVEFETPSAGFIDGMELLMRRDESILRFLTVKLNKYGVKYNKDKREGRIGKKREQVQEEIAAEKENARERKQAQSAQNVARKEARADAKVQEITRNQPVATADEVKPTEIKERDDLKKIEGIGPKIENILNQNGIFTYGQLAAADPANVREFLSAAKLGSHDPGTWGEQSQLAADGKWDALKKWQDELDGGRVTGVVVASEEE